MSNISHLECSKCGEHLSADQPRTICPRDGGSLYVRYNLDAIKKTFTRESLAGRTASMWRYADVLPDAPPVTLGEGFTPMLPSRKTPNVFIKDEGINPTGSFKARGMSAAVTMARAYGLKKLAAPSAGNAASALACYCAAAGIEAHIFMPKDVPQANLIECQSYGAHVNLVDGLISDCARIIAERKEKEGWFDVSTLKEPFRVEGKKTMGYEIAEQLGWTLPDAVIYPTGGGVGLIGMWKAFDEMQQLGWIKTGAKRPQDDLRSIHRLRAHRQSLERAQALIRSLEERRHHRCRSARSQSLRRLHRSRHPEAKLRHRRRRHRRRDHGIVSILGARRRASSPLPKAPHRWPPTTSSAPPASLKRATPSSSSTPAPA